MRLHHLYPSESRRCSLSFNDGLKAGDGLEFVASRVLSKSEMLII